MVYIYYTIYLANLDTPEGAYCYSLIESAIKFDENWYGMPISKVKKIVSKQSKNGFVHIQFSYKELGLSEEWFEQQCRLVNYDLTTIKREILLEWLLSDDNSVFSEEQLDALHQHTREPIGHFYIDNIYKFYIFEELYGLNKRNYIISVDVAGGLENDSSVITIIDPLTYHPVALFKSNNIDTVELKDLLVKLTTQLFTAGVIVPERNNHGLSLIQMLLRTEVSNKIYWQYRDAVTDSGSKNDNPHNKSLGYSNKAVKTKKRIKVYGIDTSAKSRPIMVNDILNMIVNEKPEFVNNEFLYNDIKTLARDKKGKIAAREGCHDDIIMSYLVGLYMISYGKNVNKFVKVTYIGEDSEGNINKLASKTVKKNVKSVINILNSREVPIQVHINKSLIEMDRMSNVTGVEPDNPIYKSYKEKKSNNYTGSTSNRKTSRNIDKFRKMIY